MQNNPRPKNQEDTPSRFHYPIKEIIRLPHLTSSHFNSTDFWEILSKRKSTRNFQQITLDIINKILWSSAKVKELYVQDNGYILSHRAYPSAGARHPIDILIQSETLGNENSLYYYNPFEHSLNKLESNTILMKGLRDHVNSLFDPNSNSEKGTIFWFLAHIDRSGAKYENPISLIWRDAGAVINCIQLSCTALNLNSCAIGSLGEPYMSQLFLNTENIVSAGGIIVG